MAAAAADSVKRIKAEASCSICLDLFRDPLTTECGHSFCRPCIARHRQGRDIFTCPQCRQQLRKGDLNQNRELRDIVELLKSQTAGKPAGGFMCERHGEPLKLYCNEDQTPVCLVCMQSEAHRGHSVVPKEEAVQEYRGKMAEQLGVIESSCGKLHQFVSEIWKHLPQNEQDEERQNLARVSEKLRGLQERTGSPGERFADTASQTEPQESPSESDCPESEISKETELEGYAEREPSREQDFETEEETGSHVGPVSQKDPTRKQELSQAALDEAFHKISSRTGDAEPKVDARQTENSAEDGPSPTPAEGSGGSVTDATPASRKQKGAAMGGGNEAAGQGQPHPGSKAAKKKKRKNKKSR